MLVGNFLWKGEQRKKLLSYNKDSQEVKGATQKDKLTKPNGLIQNASLGPWSRSQQ